VLRTGSNPRVYAGAILRVCEFYLATPTTVMSRATGSNLKQRIEDIMTERIVRETGSATKLLLTGTALVFAAVPVVFGMSAHSPRADERPPLRQEITPVAGGTAAAAAGTPLSVGSPARRTETPAVSQQAGTASGVDPARTAPPPAEAPEQGGYIIGLQDELEIYAWRDQELTRSVVVRPDGKIGVPLLGDVQAAGLTPLELESEIRRRLTRFLSQPQVTVIVAVATRPKVTIQGAVAAPGLYTLNGHVTVLELIAHAGGLTEFARRDEIAVFRNIEGATETYRFNYSTFVAGRDLTQNLTLSGGDIVIVP
jgi:polysaccharide export outer membrane protein